MDDVISDYTESIFNMIVGSAPERRDELALFCNDYGVRFLEVNDKTGIVMNATKDRVAFARKDLQVIWLLAFSLWKAIALFAPHIMSQLLFRSPVKSILELDTDLDRFERDYRERLNSVVQLIEDEVLDESRWPPDIPKPGCSRDDLASIEHKAVYDLAIMTIAVAFLHELRHVKFHRDHVNGTTRPTNPAMEEMECDIWARDWLMSKVGEYANVQNHTYERVASKRAMALLIMGEFLRLANSFAGTFGSKEYPPLADRVSAISGGISLPDSDAFWIVSSCVLYGEARRQGGRYLELPSASPRMITRFLLGVLNA